MGFLMKDIWVLDCEVYPNYFLLSLKNIRTSEVKSYEIKGGNNRLTESVEVRKLLKENYTFGFNSLNYDLPVINFALKGKRAVDIYELSKLIITKGLNRYKLAKIYQDKSFCESGYFHFDIMEVAPGVGVSLKLYGARLHAPKLQDLPYDPHMKLDVIKMSEVKDYCENDLDTTIFLYNTVKERVQLRYKMYKKYNDFSIMSKSDAQIAEFVIKNECKVFNKFNSDVKYSKKIRYKAPDYINSGFLSENLNMLLEFIKVYEFGLNDKGSILMPPELKKWKIKIGDTQYQMGLGGIHSKESGMITKPKQDELLIDKDVASYYPQIILTNRLYPLNVGEKFLKVYEKIVKDRLKAKEIGDKTTNESLKIVINGSFGKFGNKYSILYSPDLLINTTLTGQLSLLKLIERLEDKGIKVVSANTDGFVSLMKKNQYDLFEKICSEWELETQFKLESSNYKALYSRDVNNYFAVSDKGIKSKGIFAETGLVKNPQAEICVDAVKEYLVNDISLEETIKNCKDLRKFLKVRTVKGGGVWSCLDIYLGRVVRWIYSTDGCQISYSFNFYKVAGSDGARPIMDLEDFPDDLDYEKYINESIDILKTLKINYNQGELL